MKESPESPDPSPEEGGRSYEIFHWTFLSLREAFMKPSWWICLYILLYYRILVNVVVSIIVVLDLPQPLTKTSNFPKFETSEQCWGMRLKKWGNKLCSELYLHRVLQKLLQNSFWLGEHSWLNRERLSLWNSEPVNVSIFSIRSRSTLRFLTEVTTPRCVAPLIVHSNVWFD